MNVSTYMTLFYDLNYPTLYSGIRLSHGLKGSYKIAIIISEVDFKNF